jgi:N-dimethylarginine dimethylaminohydrolase
MTRFLMCPPDFYGIEYEINPWMHREHPADHDLAISQWDDLYRTLHSMHDVEIELIHPREGLPDMVFTANAGVVHGNTFISSRFRYMERQGESPHFETWFAEQGYEVVRLADDARFEGAGDVLKAGGTWYGGYYFRSAPQALAAVSDILHEEVLPLRLVDERFYHLDTCFCALGESIIYYPGAFDDYSLTVIRDRFPDAAEVAEDEAFDFACNAVVVDNQVVTNSTSPKLCAAVEERGFECHPVGLSEFIKAGGSAKCLTLRLE